MLGQLSRLVPLCLLLLAWTSLAAARDYYDILSITRHADDAQIKRAYRKLALKYHPDKVTGTEKERQEAAKKFAEINHAYETLSDAEKRRIYDHHGEEGLKQHAGQESGGRGGPANIFDFFFGGGFGGGRQEEEEQIPKGATVYVDLLVTLQDLYVGKEIKTVRDKPVHKPASGTRRCKCKQKLVTQQLGPGMFQQFTQNVCEECPALKLEREKDTITVHVEPGMKEGQEISFFEEGEPMMDGEPGDLKFRIRTLPHPLFQRNNSDLHVNRTISLVDALTGFSHTITHLDGHNVTIAAAGVTRPGDVQLIAGEGMPVFGQDSSKGNLYVTYTVDFPAALDEQQKATVRSLFGSSGSTAAASSK